MLTFWGIREASALNQSARTVVVLFDSTIEKKPQDSLARIFIEGPLNALGLAVRYADLNQLNTAELFSNDIRALVTAFPVGARIKNPKKLSVLLTKALDQNKKIMLFGELCFLFDAQGNTLQDSTTTQLLERLGIEFSGDFATNSIDYQIETTDKSFAHQNAKAAISFTQVPTLKIRTEQNKIITQGKSAERNYPLTIINPQYGLISVGDTAYSIYQATPQTTPIREWYLNPLALFSEVLELSNTLRYDTTSRNGARIVIGLIEGSGWTQRSSIEKYIAPPTLSIDVLHQELSEANQSTLYTVAPVMAEFRSRAVDDSLVLGAQSLFSDPRFVPATAGVSNIYQWPDADNGHITKQEFHTASANPEKEIGNATALLNTILHSPPDEKLCFVSSDTSIISGAAKEYLAANNLCSIVGGNTRIDPLHPNLAWLEPLSDVRILGNPLTARLPTVFPMASERTFITESGSLEYSYRHLIETIKASESPMRLMPIGLRFGIQAGGSPARLNSIKKILAELPDNLYPMQIADYAETVHDFQSAKFESCGQDCWQVLKRGSLQSLRISAAQNRTVNISRSPGVLGSRRINDELFISLDPKVSMPMVVLTNSQQNEDLPSLIESTWSIQGLKRDNNSLTFETSGTALGKMKWRIPWKEKSNVSIIGDKNSYDRNLSGYTVQGDILSVSLMATYLRAPVKIKVTRGGAQ